MGLLDRFARVVRANISGLVNQAEDPEKILQQAVEEMQDNLIQLRQAVAQAIATQKRTERQCAQSQTTAQEWYNRAELALQKGDDDLARQALTRRSTLLESARVMEAQLGQQAEVVSRLKDNMRTLEAKIAEAKTKKDMYIARARSAEASQRIQEMIGQTGSGAAISAFERMEEKIMDLEARSEALAELNQGDPLEQRFAALERAPDAIDHELAAMKTRLITGTDQSDQLPPAR